MWCSGHRLYEIDGHVVIVSIWDKTASTPPNSLVLKECEVLGSLAEGTFKVEVLI